jgi:hypothetical protein
MAKCPCCLDRLDKQIGDTESEKWIEKATRKELEKARAYVMFYFCPACSRATVMRFHLYPKD